MAITGAESVAAPNSWVTRRHPRYAEWKAEEDRMMASYIATLAVLTPFLVPHRFEGAEKSPEKLNRARFGYGIGLNKAYLRDVHGHLRRAEAAYRWGPLTGVAGNQEAVSAPPSTGLAKDLWDDATRSGTSWRNFWMRTVLVGMTATRGGVVVVDSPQWPVVEGAPAQLSTSQARAQGLRPYVRYVPWSKVLDMAEGPYGLEWIKMVEAPPSTGPRNDRDTRDRVVLYELLESGLTRISRWQEDGKQVGDNVDLPKIVDPQGQPMLPVVPAVYGEHPTLPVLGSGLLEDLTDIVLDMFNVVSETREAFRDAAFSLLTYTGTAGTSVQDFIEKGSRFVDLGDAEGSKLERVQGGTEEVEAGLKLLDQGLRAWMEAAARQAADAQQRSQPKSGIALQAEFQLDIAPLLREVVGAVDQTETNAMWVIGQLAGNQVSTLENVSVRRNDDFDPEAEAERITRLVTDYKLSGLPMPAALKAAAAERWWETSDLVDLDQDFQLADGSTVKLRDYMKQQLQLQASQDEQMARNSALAMAQAATQGAPPPFPTEDAPGNTGTGQ